MAFWQIFLPFLYYQFLNIYQESSLQVHIVMKKYPQQIISERKNKQERRPSTLKTPQSYNQTQQRPTSQPKTQYNYLSSFLRKNINSKHKQPAPEHQRFKTSSQNPSSSLINDANNMNISIAQLDQIKQRYQTLQQLLSNQNTNLKLQSQYLSSQIRKLYKRQKYYKDLSKQLNNKNLQLEHNFNNIMQQNQSIKRFLDDVVVRLISKLKSIHLEASINGVKDIVRQICQFFQIKVQVEEGEMEGEGGDYHGDEFQGETKSRFHGQSQGNANGNGNKKDKKAPQEQFEQRISQLNDKFQAMMYEYKSTNNSQLRKQCIQIAREIKDMKNKQQLSSKQQLPSCRQTIQTLSRNQSKQLKQLQKHVRPQTHKYSRSFDEQDNTKQILTKKIRNTAQFKDNITSKTNFIDFNSQVSSGRKLEYKY